ncbi:hypothetical protein [Sphingomonas sp.]|uniref:hypothetical protein n=1 Tax=Sphingomonas sp. TaxID=28214 RepID=UPI00182D5F33|nr:hypothetical protein [Sphingomonas sp.]MBA3511018.1 hypothetical protein [Sphingomonas sp.]
MRALPLRSAAIVLVAAVGLGGCATYSPFGYGNGVSVSYGDRYHDPYYDRYSPYGSRYGSRYGYGAGYAPYGWYDGFYYPGSGYYVYDRYRNPYYWNDGQRRYWTVRQKDPSVREVWSDFARNRATTSGTSGTNQVERMTTSRVEPVRTNRVERRSEPRSSVTERIRSRIATRSEPPKED